MWGIIACVAIAILAICGVLFSKSPEKKEVASPREQKINGPKSHGNASGTNGKTTSADNKTSAQPNAEQGDTLISSSGEPPINNSSPAGNPSSNSQASQPEQTSSPQQSSNPAQSLNSQTGQSGVATKVENALKNKK